MLRTGVRTVKIARASVLLLAVMTSLLATGCFSRRYPRLMQTHLEVLSLYAAKLAALADDHRTVPIQEWGEFTYPLERARDFARVATAHYPERASLHSFEQALAAYGALVADPAVLSAAGAGATVAARNAAFTAAVEQTRADLARERGS
jgi:hypothetical protein